MSKNAAEEATDSDEPKSPGQRVKSLLEGAAALVALVVASVSLAFSLVPTLKPDEPPEKLGGSIVKAEVEQHVWQSGYEADVLHSENQDSDEPVRDVAGMVVRARVELSGYKTRHYSLRAELLDATTRRSHEYAVADGTTIGVNDQDLRPAASTDAVTFQVWVRNPSHSGRYIIRLKLFDVGSGSKDGTGDPGPLLDYWITDEFRYVRPPFGSRVVDRRTTFPGEGSYTVNGELPLGRYLLVPRDNDGACLWARLAAGSNPEDAFLGEDVTARGVANRPKRILLQRQDRYLAMEGCKSLKYLGPRKG